MDTRKENISATVQETTKKNPAEPILSFEGEPEPTKDEIREAAERQGAEDFPDELNNSWSVIRFFTCWWPAKTDQPSPTTAYEPSTPHNGK